MQLYICKTELRVVMDICYVGVAKKDFKISPEYFHFDRKV